MKTLIAIPCMDTVPVTFAESLLNLQKPQQTAVCFKASSLIYDARNLLALTAIENNFDRVLWLDSDMDVPINTLTRLSEDMDAYGWNMVTGVYFKRRFPAEPVIFENISEPTLVNGIPERHIDTYKSYPRNSLFQIAGCGFGCVMTSVPLLKRVWDKYKNAFLPFPWAGEDISFCHRVNLLGETIFCDSTIRCGHVGQYVYQEKDFVIGGRENWEKD